MRTKQVPEPNTTVLRNMWVCIGAPDHCWPWKGAINPDGYAHNMVDGSGGKTYPHRMMFKWFKWDIPDGMTIDHLCKNRSCMNPDHMEAVTHEVNLSRNKRAYCRRGHPQVEENRYYPPSNNGSGRCLLCIKLAKKKKAIS